MVRRVTRGELQDGVKRVMWRVVAFEDGRLVSESFHENWAQVAGTIGSLIGDCTALSVYSGSGLRVLFYHSEGV